MSACLGLISLTTSARITSHTGTVHLNPHRSENLFAPRLLDILRGPETFHQLSERFT
jgi:hypothetical protein